MQIIDRLWLLVHHLPKHLVQLVLKAFRQRARADDYRCVRAETRIDGMFHKAPAPACCWQSRLTSKNDFPSFFLCPPGLFRPLLDLQG